MDKALVKREGKEERIFKKQNREKAKRKEDVPREERIQLPLRAGERPHQVPHRLLPSHGT